MSAQHAAIVHSAEDEEQAPRKALLLPPPDVELAVSLWPDNPAVVKQQDCHATTIMSVK